MSGFAKPLIVTRYAAGGYVNGAWVEGASSQVTIQASVQPASAEDLQSLPENRRALGAYKLYSSAPFQGVIEGQRNPDTVVINGDTYEVARVDPWQNGVIHHYKTLVVRVQPS